MINERHTIRRIISENKILYKYLREPVAVASSQMRPLHTNHKRVGSHFSQRRLAAAAFTFYSYTISKTPFVVISFTYRMRLLAFYEEILCEFVGIMFFVRSISIHAHLNRLQS